jgi:hypothetical protein
VSNARNAGPAMRAKPCHPCGARNDGAKRPLSQQDESQNMQYFVTRATGLIGKRLVRKPLACKGSAVCFLMLEETRDKGPALL